MRLGTWTDPCVNCRSTRWERRLESTPAQSQRRYLMDSVLNGPSKEVRHRRPYQRRRKISLPVRLPLPVRGLLEAATEAERTLAQKQCVVLLETWQGRKDRATAASELGLSPVRMWQLSQSATAGMLAGLLKQPRRRGRAIMRQVLDGKPVDDVASLRKELAELRRKLAISEELIAILRDMPGPRDKPALPPTAPKPATVRRARTGEKRQRAALPPRAASRSDSSDGKPASG